MLTLFQPAVKLCPAARSLLSSAWAIAFPGALCEPPPSVQSSRFSVKFTDLEPPLLSMLPSHTAVTLAATNSALWLHKLTGLVTASVLASMCPVPLRLVCRWKATWTWISASRVLLPLLWNFTPFQFLPTVAVLWCLWVVILSQACNYRLWENYTSVTSKSGNLLNLHRTSPNSKMGDPF